MNVVVYFKGVIFFILHILQVDQKHHKVVRIYLVIILLCSVINLDGVLHVDSFALLRFICLLTENFSIFLIICSNFHLMTSNSLNLAYLFISLHSFLSILAHF